MSSGEAGTVSLVEIISGSAVTFASAGSYSPHTRSAWSCPIDVIPRSDSDEGSPDENKCGASGLEIPPVALGSHRDDRLRRSEFQAERESGCHICEIGTFPC